jgi:MinD-like ATPase involved in chromosome partitioning or flagellar assembly
MEVIIALISVTGLVGALVFQLWLSYKERKEMMIMNKSKDVKEFEYIVDKPEEEKEEEGDKIIDIEQIPDLYSKK